MKGADGALEIAHGLEDVQHLSPRWRSRYLAANLKLFPGAGERQNPLVDRIRAALTG